MNSRLGVLICMCLFLKCNFVVAQTDSVNNIHSRDVKAWVVVYDITYPNGNPFNLNYVKQLTIVSGSKTYTASITKKGTIMAIVSNDGGKTNYSLFPSAKIAQRSSIYGEPGINSHMTTLSTGNTRKILGYSCNEIKEDVSSTCNGTNANSVTFEYLSDLDGKCNLPYVNNKDLKGLALGVYSDVTKSWTIANSIEEQFVDSAIFEVPSDYDVLTILEFSNKLEHDRKFSKQINKDMGISTAGILLDIFKEAIPDILEKIGNKDISNITIKQSAAFSPKKGRDGNEYLQSQADKKVRQIKQHDQKQYEMYMKLYRKEQAEADYYDRQYQTYKKSEDLQKSNDCHGRANEYLEKANIWK
jgi:hypothetical protein